MNLVIIFITLVIFRSWFISPLAETLSSGDWPYLFADQIRQFSYFPEARYLWLAPYYQVVTKILVQHFGLHWHLIERLFWFWPWVLLSFLASFSFTRSTIGALIYTTNTYALMIVGGGQMGVAMAYALAPLVLKSFIKVPEYILYSTSKFLISNYKFLISNSLLLAIQVMFDPRIALLTISAAILYWIVNQGNLKNMVRWFSVPLGITAVLHTYWWIPLLKNPGVLNTQIREVSREAVKFLSFASFSQTLSLLHPNWTENIFGKVYFMRPEFLIIPLIAFFSLLFMRHRQNAESTGQKTGYFVLLALLGAFLAKGSHEPFGGIYLWLFEHIPGFWLFRDSTKFYLWIALAYAFLIPFSIDSLTNRWKAKFSILPKVSGVLFVFLWVILIRQAVMHQLSGTFQSRPIEPEYVQLKNLITSLPEGGSTYWVPTLQRFGFTSKSHPAISLGEEIPGEDLTAILSTLQSTDTEIKLKQKGVVYVVVPYDTSEEIFLTDRAFDQKKYEQTIGTVDKISWLKPVESFTKIRVWKIL